MTRTSAISKPGSCLAVPSKPYISNLSPKGYHNAWETMVHTTAVYQSSHSMNFSNTSTCMMENGREDCTGAGASWIYQGGGPGLSKIRVSLQSTTFPGAAPGCPYRVLLFAGPTKREAWGLGYHPRPGPLAEVEKAGGPGLRPTKQACHPTGLSYKGVLTECYFLRGAEGVSLQSTTFCRPGFGRPPSPPVDSGCERPSVLAAARGGVVLSVRTLTCLRRSNSMAICEKSVPRVRFWKVRIANATTATPTFTNAAQMSLGPRAAEFT
eukprot:gene20338-biopygen20596